MENIKKTILGIIGAVFLMGLLGTPVLGDLDGIDNSDIVIDNCEGSTVDFTLYTNSQNSEYDAPVTVNGVTKMVTVPAEHGSVSVTFLAEDILSDMEEGTETVTVTTEDYSGTTITENVDVAVTGCGVVCNVANDILDDVDFEDEVAPEEELDVEISLDNQESQKFFDVQLKVWIEDENGDRLGDREETDEFDLSIDEEEEETLTIEIPDDADEGMYTLYLRANSDEGCLFEETYELEITRDEDSLKIDKVGFDSQIEGGDDFNVAVTMLNNGQNDQEDVKVTVELRELGLSQTSQYFDIEEDEKITQYFTLTVPEYVNEGEYTLEIVAESDEVTAEKEYMIKVLGEQVIVEPEVSAELSVLQATKTLAAGTGDIFRITVMNTGDEMETFSFKAAGTTGWATHSIEPGIATIEAGDSEDVYLYVSPKENTEEQEYSITFYAKKGGETVASTSLTGIVENEEEAGIDFVSEEMGVWVFVIVIIVIAVLFSIWTYTTSMKEEKKADKKGKGKEKYY